MKIARNHFFVDFSRDRPRRSRSRSHDNDDRRTSSSKTEQKSQNESIPSSVTVGTPPTLSSIVETVLPETSEASIEKDPKSSTEQSSIHPSSLEENSSKSNKKHKKHHKKHRRQRSKSKKRHRSKEKEKEKEKKNDADSPSTAIVPVQS